MRFYEICSRVSETSGVLGVEAREVHTAAMTFAKLTWTKPGELAPYFGIERTSYHSQLPGLPFVVFNLVVGLGLGPSPKPIAPSGR